MRKKKITLFYLMLMIGIVTQAQQLSIKPYFTYHHAISSQTEPVFRDRSEWTPSWGTQEYPVSSFSEDFTLANGWEAGLTAAYTFPNHLGVELGIGYFSGINNTFTDVIKHFTIDWDYHSVAVRPMFSYAVVKGKSTFTGKIGPVLHLSSATQNLIEAHYIMGGIELLELVGYTHWDPFVFDTKLSWGYAAGLAYEYQLSKLWGVAITLGFVHYRYTPGKATIDYENSTVDDSDIFYVNEINQSSSSPLKHERLTESILFNNLYLGIAISYNLWKK